MRTDDFDYDLPEASIAQRPLSSRDAARLLRVRDLTDHHVRDLPRLLRGGDLVVVNTTKVRAARLRAHRSTGGSIELLLLAVLEDGTWDVLVRPARRLSAGERITISPTLAADLLSDPVGGRVQVRLDHRGSGSIEDAIDRIGEMPLPPYIRASLDDPDRYQTVFAERVASAAAPTAGLHFTPDLIADLEAHGIGIARIELEVGLDTFRPITADLVADHQIHTERCSMDSVAAKQINAARAAGGRIVAVGTTVARTLESFASGGGVVEPGDRTTELYITPGYRFRTVDVLMTNFHVPRSSLLVMVAAFIGDQWRGAYATALERGYRFLSFGDAMLLERNV